MSLITIESNPVSSGGTCNVESGQEVTFYVSDGVSDGTYVSYEWYLNNNLVSIGSGYTLANPTQDDEVKLYVLNCAGNSLRIGDWIEDIPIYYKDAMSAGRLYYLDISSSFDYEILSVVLMSDSSLDNVGILIDGSYVIWPSAATTVDVTSIITETVAVSANSVSIGNAVTLLIPSSSSTSTYISGKMKIRRTSI